MCAPNSISIHLIAVETLNASSQAKLRGKGCLWPVIINVCIKHPLPDAEIFHTIDENTELQVELEDEEGDQQNL